MTHDPLCRYRWNTKAEYGACDCAVIAKARADERADLHARVEALVEYGCPEWEIDPGDDLGRHVRKDQVLALFGGTSNPAPSSAKSGNTP